MKAIKEVRLNPIVNGDEYRNIFNSVLVYKPNILLLDMQQVASMDSSGLGAIISALKTIRSWGGRIAICAPSPMVVMLLQITNTHKLFSIYRSYHEFHLAHEQEVEVSK
jgi:anti-anti-sigma factor